MKSLLISVFLLLLAVTLGAQTPTVTTSKSDMVFRIPACSSITSLKDTVTVTNTGSDPVWIEFNVPITGVPELDVFTLISPTSPSTLQPGQSQDFIIKFEPRGTLTASNSLNFLFLAISNPDRPWVSSVNLRSILDSVILTPSTRQLQFDPLLSCQRESTLTFRITNNGTATDTITNINLPAPFRIFPAPIQIIEPGRSVNFFVTFAPVLDGNYNGYLTYSGRPCGFADSIWLQGSRIQPSYQTAGVNFGDVTVGGSGAANATVTNRNGSAIRIIGAQINPPTPEITVDMAQFPVRIPAGGSGTVELEFAPTALGDLPPGITVQIQIDSVCNTILPVPITGTGIRGGIEPGRNEMDFGALLSCQSAEDTLFLRNIGNAPVQLSDAVLDPPEAAAYYTITQGRTSPGILQPRDVHIVIIRFSPGQGPDGPVNGRLMFTSSDPLRPAFEVGLTGSRISQQLAIEGDPFPPTFMGLTSRATRRLINTGSAPVDIVALPITAPFTLISTVPQLPATLLPGDTMKIELEFAPEAQGIYINGMQVTGATRCSTLEVLVQAEADDLITGMFHWGTASGTIGGKVRIPLLLDNDVTRADVTSFTASARFNPSLLIPERIVAGELLPADWTLTSQQFRPGHIAFSAGGRTTLGGPGTLAYLEARVMLGDSVATFMEAGDTLAFHSRATRTALTRGLFSLEGYCDEGSPRLVQVDGMFGLKRVMPNPVQRAAAIAFETIEHGDVQMLLFDALGRPVSVLLEERLEPGPHLIQLDARDLPAGLYHLELRTPTQRERTTVVVAR